jgi:hypothetical protein
MPPPGRGKRLAPREVALLRAWIDQGLTWDDALLPPPAAPTHWAFRPIRRPAVPPGGPTPIDAILAQARRERELTPGTEAPRRVLIRRLMLDLIGLPPAPEEIDAFERDSSPDAYDRLVERLLGSIRHGERYARHWLDLARYADSEGYESNHLRPHAWRYRDWVVDSLNRDRPFADFVRLQLAGDEVRPYSDDNLIATGYLAAARLSSNEEDTARQRNDILVDIVNATATALLGLTMHCAQCHNHKFDPITARDYYRFQAFFIRGQPGNLALQDPALLRDYRAALPAGYEAALARLDALLDASRARLVAAAKRALPANQCRALDLPPDRRNNEEEGLARAAKATLRMSTTRIEASMPASERTEYLALKTKLAEWAKRVPDRPQTFGFYAPATAAARLEVLPMRGFYPLPFEPAELTRLPAHLLVGGDVHQRGPALTPGWPAVFGPTHVSRTRTPRLALADWLTGPSNPLAARVHVNRLWQWHFGSGLVKTPGDFGTRGAAPSHPELLDWLASELVRTGSSKHVHRLIVRSAAYRQSSAFHAGNARLDPDNVYLWRFSPRRLEAEVIRDSLLAVSGELDERAGGAPDTDEKTSKRRGLYLLQNRDFPPMVQSLFDGPSASAESCPRRGVSTVPLQALYLLNNDFVHGRAAALARRAQARAGSRPRDQIRTAFLLALGRPPDDVEQTAALRFFARSGDGPSGNCLQAFCQALVNVNEFVYLE